MKNIIHVISLSRGLGGVQSSFISYYKYAQKHSQFKHCVFSPNSNNKNYGKIKNFYNLKKNFFSFLKHLYSNNSIIYFHNMLGKKKIFYLLKIFPSNNIIFHEHGGAWTIKTKIQLKTYQANAKLAKKIIVNSIATKQMLIKRFKIRQGKLDLVYYGFKDPNIKKNHQNKKSFKVGILARLESIKGIHNFIAASNLLKTKKINFFIGGDGNLEGYLKQLANQNNNIFFVGNVARSYNFLKKLDILVVPSIREPLGIVNIEAGLCKLPVIASNIDGIPEVIINGHSGILITPTNKISLTKYSEQPPLPDYVVQPSTYKLIKPKELSAKILAKKILLLIKSKKLRSMYGSNLYKNVKKKFSIENYFKSIEQIYKDQF